VYIKGVDSYVIVCVESLNQSIIIN